jgi:hypothetical protein
MSGSTALFFLASRRFFAGNGDILLLSASTFFSVRHILVKKGREEVF